MVRPRLLAFVVVCTCLLVLALAAMPISAQISGPLDATPTPNTRVLSSFVSATQASSSRQIAAASKVTLHSMAARIAKAQSTAPALLKYRLAITNGGPYPVTFLTGCGVAPALVVHAHNSLASYKLQVYVAPRTNKCVPTVHRVDVGRTATFTYKYRLQATVSSNASAQRSIPNGDYIASARFVYTSAVSMDAQRYRPAGDGHLIDTWPTTWTVSPSLPLTIPATNR